MHWKIPKYPKLCTINSKICEQMPLLKKKKKIEIYN